MTIMGLLVPLALTFLGVNRILTPATAGFLAWLITMPFGEEVQLISFVLTYLVSTLAGSSIEAYSGGFSYSPSNLAGMLEVKEAHNFCGLKDALNLFWCKIIGLGIGLLIIPAIAPKSLVTGFWSVLVALFLLQNTKHWVIYLFYAGIIALLVHIGTVNGTPNIIYLILAAIYTPALLGVRDYRPDNLFNEKDSYSPFNINQSMVAFPYTILALTCPGYPQSAFLQKHLKDPSLRLKVISFVSLIIEGWNLKLIGKSTRSGLAEFVTNKGNFPTLDINLFLQNHAGLLVIMFCLCCWAVYWLDIIGLWELLKRDNSFCIGLKKMGLINYLLTTLFVIYQTGTFGIFILLTGLAIYYLVLKRHPELSGITTIIPVMM